MWETVPEGWNVVGVGDFNGDGISDILLRNTDGTIVDWLGSTTGDFTANDANSYVTVGLDWNVAGTGSFNGDGRSDILWRNNDGAIFDFLGTFNGGVANNGDNSYVSVGTDWHVAGVGDFNGDGRADILWRNDSGAMFDFLGTASGGFISNGDNSYVGIDASSTVVGTGDFNGDGRTDVLVQTSSGAVVDWLGAANGGFLDNGNVSWTATPAGNNVAGIGDFNGDGRADILWRDASGAITDWLGQANGSFVDNSAVASQPLSTDLQVAGVGDFNGDGKSDMLLRGVDGTLETWVGSANGAILSPTEKLWQDALANVSAFFDEITNQVDSYAPPPQNQASTYDMGDVGGPIGPDFDLLFHEFWSLSQSVQQYYNASAWNYLAYGNDPLFDLLMADQSGISVDFGGNFGSMNLIDSSSNTFLFDMNGTFLEGSWYEGPSPTQPIEAGSIVITGHLSAPTGYFLFNPISSGFNFTDGYGGGGGGGGGSTAPAPTYSTSNEAVAALHAQLALANDRDTKEHFGIVYKDAAGYHVSPLFTGTGLNGVLSPLFNWMIANGVQFSQVTSLYHNHDAYEYGMSEAANANRYPSLADWHSAADYFVNHNADPTVFTLILEDVDHVVRSFAYSQEQSFTSLSADQKDSGYLLPPELPMQ